MPCNASILPYDPHGFPSYPHQDALSKRHPVAMDDCAQRIDSPSTKFPPPVLILKAIYLRTGIQFQFQFPSKIAFDGALFTLKQKAPPMAVALFALAPAIRGKQTAAGALHITL